jgi:hypothetical protein
VSDFACLSCYETILTSNSCSDDVDAVPSTTFKEINQFYIKNRNVCSSSDFVVFSSC